MSALLNAAPKPIRQGIKDESTRQLPVIPAPIPTHLPHVFLFTEKGPLEPQLVAGADLLNTFGSKTLNLRGPYTTHQTVLAQSVNAEGNTMVVQRVKPSDANEPAKMRLVLETVGDDIDEYDRDGDGNVIYDQDGNPTTSGTTTTGFRARWMIQEITDSDPLFGEAMQTTGSLTGTALDSTVYPIMDFEISSFGSHGNNKGIRIWSQSTNTLPSVDEELINDQNAYVYNIQMIERDNKNTQPDVVETLTGATSVAFMLKEGGVDKRTDRELHADEVILQQYQNLDLDPKIYGPFGRMHVYQDDIEAVLTELVASEQPNHPEWPSDLEEAKHLINLFGGHDIDGNPYYTFRLEGVSNGGVEFTRFSNHYATGGSDGTLTNAEFDTQVADIVENYGSSTFNFKDTAIWPQSVIYDSGFTIETKKKMFNVLGARHDMAVVVSTQDVTQDQNSTIEETSIAIALRTKAEAFPESTIYGTPVARAMIIGHSGYLINSRYKGLMPLTVEFATKAARFMGRGNGIWRQNRGFDVAPYNQINMFKDVNATYKPQATYNNDWDNGLVWVQNFDRRSLFFPGIQTVYNNSTSVLNSAINMFIAIEAKKVADRVWRLLTGTAKLTRQQFIERSDALISERLNSQRFDDRVIVVPRTYFTDFDELLGYSWSTDITLYMNNMMTVGTYTIISQRRSAFEG